MIVRKQTKLCQTQKVLEHHMLRQLQSVSAADRDALALESANDLLEQDPASAHQNEEVAIADRAKATGLGVAILYGVAALDLSLDVICDLLSQNLIGALFRLGIDRFPRVDLLLGRALDQRPQVHGSKACRTARQMGDDIERPLAIGLRRAQAKPRLWIEEHAVHKAEHLRRRAPAFRQRHRLELALNLFDQGLEMLAFRQKTGGISPLERKDRLFLVTDGKDRPRVMAFAAQPSRPDKELFGQGADDVPLVRRRILRLVDQNVVNAAVELIEHPGRIRPHG